MPVDENEVRKFYYIYSYSLDNNVRKKNHIDIKIISCDLSDIYSTIY
jgi:hypothetical protein